MTITFDNGKMIVTHPSGRVDTYDLLDLQNWLNKAKLFRDDAELVVENLESDIILLTNSI